MTRLPDAVRSPVPPPRRLQPQTAVPIPPPISTEGPLGPPSLEGAANADEPLVLDLEATELSWVVIQVDGGSPQEALLRPGEKAKWKGQDQFMLTLGNAGGVKAELNGKPQKAFGPKRKSCPRHSAQTIASLFTDLLNHPPSVAVRQLRLWRNGRKNELSVSPRRSSTP